MTKSFLGVRAKGKETKTAENKTKKRKGKWSTEKDEEGSEACELRTEEKGGTEGRSGKEKEGGRGKTEEKGRVDDKEPTKDIHLVEEGGSKFEEERTGVG